MLWGGGQPREIPPSPELDRTRSLINQAAKNATVNSHFKPDIERARAVLDQAVMLWNEEDGKPDEDDEEWREISHLNYLARQRTAIIVMQARGLDAQRELRELQSERERMLAYSRKTEAPRAVSTAASELPQVLQALRPRQEARGLVLTLDDSHFENDKPRLANSDVLLDALLQYLVANPAKSVACEGYSDAQPGEVRAQLLSQQRARAVQEALLERGLEFSRVTAVGYGSTSPLPGSQGELAGRNNRRVEIVIAAP
jgi:outer membrane protein OmpA-like peptidoglycan-associated protein